MRTRCLVAEAGNLVLFIRTKIAFEPLNMAVTFESQDMCCQSVKEETVMADDHSATSEAFKRLFKCGQGFYVKIVRGLIEQKHVAALFQHLCHVHAVTFTTRQ